jgi:hypothetical protein
MGATRLDCPDSGLGLLVQRAPIASRSLASAAGQRALVTPSGDVPFITRGAIQWHRPGQARSSFAWVRGWGLASTAVLSAGDLVIQSASGPSAVAGGCTVRCAVLAGGPAREADTCSVHPYIGYGCLGLNVLYSSGANTAPEAPYTTKTRTGAPVITFKQPRDTAHMAASSGAHNTQGPLLC